MLYTHGDKRQFLPVGDAVLPDLAQAAPHLAGVSNDVVVDNPLAPAMVVREGTDATRSRLRSLYAVMQPLELQIVSSTVARVSSCSLSCIPELQVLSMYQMLEQSLLVRYFLRCISEPLQ